MDKLERFEKTARANAALLSAIVKEANLGNAISYQRICELLLEHAENGNLSVHAILSGKDWYDYQAPDIEQMLLNEEISESLAGYYLDLDIVRMRVHMEYRYGSNWRDLIGEEKK